jgi:hypothetical protein
MAEPGPEAAARPFLGDQLICQRINGYSCLGADDDPPRQKLRVALGLLRQVVERGAEPGRGHAERLLSAHDLAG